MITIDASGLSCPEPIIKLKKALAAENAVRLIVDNKISSEACSRYAKSKGYAVSLAKEGRVYIINVQKD
jgi:TusA-related sulfurtransferase